MKKLSIVAKERRSSVGFFDFVKFRGFLDGGVDRKVAKVAKGRKEEGASEDGVSEFQSFIFISTHLRESSSSAVKKSKCAAQEEGVSEDGFSERWIQLN
jgi:hypothetical protein